jgi:hypothetical protein
MTRLASTAVVAVSALVVALGAFAWFAASLTLPP